MNRAAKAEHLSACQVLERIMECADDEIVPTELFPLDNFINVVGDYNFNYGLYSYLDPLYDYLISGDVKRGPIDIALVRYAWKQISREINAYQLQAVGRYSDAKIETPLNMQPLIDLESICAKVVASALIFKMSESRIKSIEPSDERFDYDEISRQLYAK